MALGIYFNFHFYVHNVWTSISVVSMTPQTKFRHTGLARGTEKLYKVQSKMAFGSLD